MHFGSEQIALVTGASRGAGRGIALALGKTGATVYLTGRPETQSNPNLSGTLMETAELVTKAGGQGMPIFCDHSNDAQTDEVVAQIAKNHGRLDILVNNATAIDDAITNDGPFWEKPISLCDLLDVGLRSHYTVSWYAAPLLVANKGALVVNTSSFGGKIYMHGPAYGAGKAGVDKMAHDMAIDFQPFGVAVVSLWMGLLLTERTQKVFERDRDRYAELLDSTESPELSGRIISQLASQDDLMHFSGQVLIGAELAKLYSLKDKGGKEPISYREVFCGPTEFGDVILR